MFELSPYSSNRWVCVFLVFHLKLYRKPPTRDRFACQSCGFTADADTNAARNIADRAVVILPDERVSVKVGAQVQNPPFTVG